MADNQRDQQRDQAQRQGGRSDTRDDSLGNRSDVTTDRDQTRAQGQEGNRNRDAGQGGQVGGPNQRDTRDPTRENR